MDKNESEPNPSVFSLVSRFFTIPLIIVAICIAIFYFFGRLAHDTVSIEDYLTDIRSGSSNRRWQAAYELSKKIRREEVRQEYGQKIAQTLSEIYFKQVGEADPRLRQYAILILAELARPDCAPVFEAALKDNDSKVVFYAIGAVAQLKQPELSGWLHPFLKNDDAALRSIAAYSLGVLGNKEAIPWLKESLHDATPDVQWNAALALAQLSDDSGLTVIHQLLDPTYLSQFTSMKSEQKRNVIASAVNGVLLLNDKTALPLLEQLATTEQDPALVEQIRKSVDRLK